MRKLTGTVLTLVVLVIYAWLATTIYVAWLTTAPALVALAYFVVAGLLWAVPIAYIIRWMARPDQSEPQGRS